MEDAMTTKCPTCNGDIDLTELSKIGKPFKINCPHCGREVSGGFGSYVTLITTEWAGGGMPGPGGSGGKNLE